MANNLFANIPALVVARSNINFSSIGAITEASIRKIHKVGSPMKIFVPGGSGNTITGFEAGAGYLIEPLQNLDLSAYLVPPIPTATDNALTVDGEEVTIDSENLTIN